MSKNRLLKTCKVFFGTPGISEKLVYNMDLSLLYLKIISNELENKVRKKCNTRDVSCSSLVSL